MKNYFLLFTLLFCNIVWSQEVKTSKDFKIVHAAPYEVIDGTKYYMTFDNVVVSIKFSRKGFHLQKFEGEKMALKSRKDFPALPSGSTISAVIPFNGKALVLYELYDKSNTSEQVFAFEVDPITMKVGKTTKLLSTKKKVRGTTAMTGFYKFQKLNKFHVSTNFDNNILMINYSLVPEIKKDKNSKEVVGFHVFDETLTKVWSQEMKMPEFENRLDVNQSCIDKNFNVHLLVKIFHDDSRKDQLKDGTLNHHWEMFNVDGETKDMERTKLGLRGTKVFRSMNFFEGDEDDIILAGYYADNAKSAPSGSFTILLSNLGEQSDAITTPFDIKEFKKYNKEKQQAKIDKNSNGDDVSIGSLRLRDVRLLPDGSITTAGEVYYVVSHVDSKGRVTYTYYSQDIYAMNVQKDGTLNWFRKIPKNQVSGGTYGLGYSLITNGTDNYFVFLDNVKNLGLSTTDRPAVHNPGRGGFLTSYKIESSGKVTQHSILDTKQFKEYSLYQFSPTRILPLVDGFAVEFYIKKKQDLMIRVRFSESKSKK